MRTQPSQRIPACTYRLQFNRCFTFSQACEIVPYLHALGVSDAYASPYFQASPESLHGYDITDHTDVEPMFGALDDADALIAAAHERGLRLLLDFVPNHTSEEHPWFREHPEYYRWADEPPNNWISVFGGPGWTLDPERGRFYYHAYLREQPDLDWRNPELRRKYGRFFAWYLLERMRAEPVQGR